MTGLEQKAKEYVAKKADSGNFDVEQFGKVYFSESSMEHALVDFATQITKELETKINGLGWEIDDLNYSLLTTNELYAKLQTEVEQLRKEKKLAAEQDARDIRTRFPC